MITRDNYQEYFLLYVDNELPTAERSHVERFVAENPDLQDEWESLLMTVIRPEKNEGMPFKHSLMRSSLDEHNYTEYFLSYVDGELNEEDRDRVAAFLQLHPSKQKELDTLYLTVSQPDPAIVFQDKDLLYKKEDRRRIVFLYRFAAGAAAVVLALITMLILEQHHQKNGPAIAEKPVKKSSPAVTPSTPAPLYTTEEEQTEEQKKPVVAKKQDKPAPTPKTSPVAPIQKIEQEEEHPIAVAATVPEKEKTTETATTATTATTASAPLIAQQVNIPKEQSNFATQALLAQEDNDKTIAAAADPASPNKSKLRGLFRKVARTFGKTADRDGEGKREVLISAFQVAVN